MHRRILCLIPGIISSLKKMTLYGRAFGRCRGIRSNACVSSFDLLLAVLAQTTGLSP
jgi:hypothetical protein